MNRFKTSLLACALLTGSLLSACQQQSNGMSDDELVKRESRAAGMPKTTMTFDEQRHDFGTIKEGAVVKHTYHVRNTGSNPLLIARVIVSCGCTVPQIPAEPIAPGGQGDITLRFDSHGKAGHVDKSVMVISNAAQERAPLTFTAEVTK